MDHFDNPYEFLTREGYASPWAGCGNYHHNHHYHHYHHYHHHHYYYHYHYNYQFTIIIIIIRQVRMDFMNTASSTLEWQSVKIPINS